MDQTWSRIKFGCSFLGGIRLRSDDPIPPTSSPRIPIPRILLLLNLASNACAMVRWNVWFSLFLQRCSVATWLQNNFVYEDYIGRGSSVISIVWCRSVREIVVRVIEEEEQDEENCGVWWWWYSIQIDPFFKFTILTTRNSLLRYNPATPLVI